MAGWASTQSGHQGGLPLLKKIRYEAVGGTLVDVVIVMFAQRRGKGERRVMVNGKKARRRSKCWSLKSGPDFIVRMDRFAFFNGEPRGT